MEYKIFVNNPWQENTVVLYDETGEAAVVDCGCFSREEEAGVKISSAGVVVEHAFASRSYFR